MSSGLPLRLVFLNDVLVCEVEADGRRGKPAITARPPELRLDSFLGLLLVVVEDRLV